MELANRAGLSTRRIVFGYWRGGATPNLLGDHFQDTLVLCRPSTLPEDFDAGRYLRMHPDVAAAAVDAAEHYLNFGLSEGRSYR